MTYAREMAEHYRDLAEDEKARARAAMLDACHKAALAVAEAHSRGAATDDEAWALGWAFDVVGQSEPLHAELRRMTAELQRPAPVKLTGEDVRAAAMAAVAAVMRRE